MSHVPCPISQEENMVIRFNVEGENIEYPVPWAQRHLRPNYDDTIKIEYDNGIIYEGKAIDIFPDGLSMPGSTVTLGNIRISLGTRRTT